MDPSLQKLAKNEVCDFFENSFKKMRTENLPTYKHIQTIECNKNDDCVKFYIQMCSRGGDKAETAMRMHRICDHDAQKP